MDESKNLKFDANTFLASAGLRRHVVELKKDETLFSQGQLADSIFYLQKGRAKLTVVSQRGKEATIAFLGEGDFVGEESLASVGGLRMATATALTACTALKIDRGEMTRVIHQEHEMSDHFLKFLLARSMRTQSDLILRWLRLFGQVFRVFKWKDCSLSSRRGKCENRFHRFSRSVGRAGNSLIVFRAFHQTGISAACFFAR